ncbi:MAG: hypothetical protein AAF378_08285 [Cyanobacteria bacterium P01_A01_bin.84]
MIDSNSANPRWWLAGYAQGFMYSGAFVSRQFTGIGHWRMGLSRPILMDLRDYDYKQYGLEFTFARWHKDVRLRVWKYTSESIDAMHQDLRRIEQKIDDISDYSV